MSSATNPLENFGQIASNGFTTPSFASPDFGSSSLDFLTSSVDEAGVGFLASNPLTSAAALPVAVIQSGTIQAKSNITAANTEASGVTAAAQNAVSGFFLGLLSTRVIAIVLGLMFVAGAFLLFVGNDISDGLKKAGPILTGA